MSPDTRTPPLPTTLLDRLRGGWGPVGIVLRVPLTAVVAIVIFWAFRRTTNRLVTPTRVASQRGPR